jgi:uncharacterized protein YcaQ
MPITTDISARDARRLFLLRQGLLRREPFGRGGQAVARAIERLGWVQIDTISVVERAHHHVLRSRVAGYRQDWLDELQHGNRSVFEYWSHAAAYLPMRDYRFYLPMMRWSRRGGAVEPKMAGEVLRRVREEGPLQSRDFEAAGHRSGGWWDWKPAKRTLEQLFHRGELMVTRREGFQKVYDLPERVLPDHVDTSFPDAAQWGRFVVRMMVDALGVANEKEIAYQRIAARRLYSRPILPMVQQAAAELVEAGELEQVTVEGRGPYLTRHLGSLPVKLGRRRITILSPFDNTVIMRDRARDLFGFDYAIECYVPAEKRRFGYFSLPILFGDELIGRMDTKADRHSGTLTVNMIHLEPGVDPALVRDPLSRTLADFARDNGCADVVVGATDPGALRRELVRALG